MSGKDYFTFAFNINQKINKHITAKQYNDIKTQMMEKKKELCEKYDVKRKSRFGYSKLMDKLKELPKEQREETIRKLLKKL